VFQAQQGWRSMSRSAGRRWIRVRHAEGQSGYIKINQVWGI